MTTDAHHAHAHRRRLWRQVCDAAVHTSNYVARHKPRRAGQAPRTWEWHTIRVFYIVVTPMCTACLVGFIKVRSGT